MKIGPDLSKVQAAAKEAVMRFFVDAAEADGTPPTLRAMYVLKTAEARAWIETGKSDYIVDEAGYRGITPDAMAKVIDDLAVDSLNAERKRMQVNVAIEGATTPSAVVAILAGLGLTLSMPA